MKKKLFELDIPEITAWFANHKAPSFTVKQFIEWVYAKGESSFEKMSNLSQKIRSLLQEEIVVETNSLVRIQESDDRETFKFLWKLEDDKLVESVLICSEDRRTVCVSSQVGCPARCAFCASGKKGLFRNLTTAEIVSQVYFIDKWLKAKGERVSHVVYMGMGEPFRNYENVLKSIRIISNPDMLGISQRRITVSTVGVVEGIRRFACEGLKVNLVLSLHAPNQQIRKKIIPYAREYDIEDVLKAMDEFYEMTSRDITYEYTLIAGINDSVENARELVHLLQRREGHFSVNLIPYNPVPGLRLQKPDLQSVKAFRKVLDDHKIVNTCRYTKGDDIAAACGQLALQESEAASNETTVKKSPALPIL